jgi:hypothetical protein
VLTLSYDKAALSKLTDKKQMFKVMKKAKLNFRQKPTSWLYLDYANSQFYFVSCSYFMKIIVFWDVMSCIDTHVPMLQRNLPPQSSG